jgi:hypothetical protein
MKAVGIIIVLVGALTLNDAALGQIRVGGHGGASAPASGSYGSRTNAIGTGRVDTGAGQHGPHVGLGGSSGLSSGIGSSRVNNAISSQGRGRSGGHSR